MSRAFAIEAGGSLIGIVVRVERGYQFVAATPAVRPFEGRIFASPSRAEREIDTFLSRPARSEPPGSAAA